MRRLAGSGDHGYRLAALLTLSLALPSGCAPEADSAPEADPGLSIPVALPAGVATPTQVASPDNPSAQLDESRNTAIVRAASRVAPAVVSISVIRTPKNLY